MLSNREEESNEDQENGQNGVGDWMGLAWEPQVIVDKVNDDHDEPGWDSPHFFLFLKSLNFLPFVLRLFRVRRSFSCRVRSENL